MRLCVAAKRWTSKEKAAGGADGLGVLSLPVGLPSYLLAAVLATDEDGALAGQPVKHRAAVHGPEDRAAEDAR
jgi:hypothetical protein